MAATLPLTVWNFCHAGTFNTKLEAIDWVCNGNDNIDPYPNWTKAFTSAVNKLGLKIFNSSHSHRHHEMIIGKTRRFPRRSAAIERSRRVHLLAAGHQCMWYWMQPSTIWSDTRTQYSAHLRPCLCNKRPGRVLLVFEWGSECIWPTLWLEWNNPRHQSIWGCVSEREIPPRALAPFEASLSHTHTNPFCSRSSPRAPRRVIASRYAANQPALPPEKATREMDLGRWVYFYLLLSNTNLDARVVVFAQWGVVAGSRFRFQQVDHLGDAAHGIEVIRGDPLTLSVNISMMGVLSVRAGLGLLCICLTFSGHSTLYGDKSLAAVSMEQLMGASTMQLLYAIWWLTSLFKGCVKITRHLQVIRGSKNVWYRRIW